MMENNKLEQLYSLRKNFTIIGLTGRTGSGCSELANVMSSSFSNAVNIRNPKDIEESVFQRKYKIVHNYTKLNWKKYKVIEYKKVLFLLLLPKLYKNPDNTILFDYYRFRLKDEPSKEKIDKLKNDIKELIISKKNVVKDLKKIGSFKTLKQPSNLTKLNNLFWGEDFNNLADAINNILKDNGLIERVMLLHHTANNFRKSGKPFKTEESDPNNIYTIAKVINRIIKATKHASNNDECHIVIDSLRNSLEINFFKERYSAFYLIAVKNDARKSNL